jgi:YfiH family protein
MSDTTKPDPLRAPALDQLQPAGIRHGYFTRVGGVSDGIYQGLNIGTGSHDDPAKVRENRRRVAAWMGVEPQGLLTAYQIHSPDVIVVSEPFPGDRPRADAIVTDTPGIAIGASTADCGPVLFADAEARVIGAAHAGWKGAFTGVLENTVAAMQRLGARPERIIAVLGPSIGPDNYEVGPEFVERFTAEEAGNERYFSPSQKAGHAMFDLNRYTVDRLALSGVAASMLDRCTYAEEELFYSYRRTTHRKEADYGRQISAIVLEKD